MDTLDKTLAPDESILWEGTPSKEVCQKVFNLGIVLTFIFVAAFIGAFLLVFNNFFSISFLNYTFSILMIFLFGFLFLIMYFMLKTMERDKWKLEHYRITNKRILRTYTLSLLFGIGKSQSTIHLDLDELYQYQVSMGIMDRRLNWNTGMISFFTGNSIFPKMFFSHVPDIDKIKEILDSIFAQKRISALEKIGASPSHSIDWHQDFDSGTAISTLCFKISLTFLLTFGVYFLFRFLFSFTKFEFNLFDQIALLYVILPFDILLSFYFLLTFIKSFHSRYFINTFGIFKENSSDSLLALQDITQILIKKPIITKLFKKSSATVQFFNDLTGKPRVKIPFSKNYEILKAYLLDLLLLKKPDIYQRILERETVSRPISPPESPPNIDLSQPEFKYLYSYLTPNEKILRLFSPNLASYKRSLTITILPILLLFSFVLIVFYTTFTFIGLSFMFVLIAVMFVPILICMVASQLYMYSRLRKTTYILTTQKVILKQDTKIEFIPLNSIESVSLMHSFSNKLFKLNTANLQLTSKQIQSSLFTRIPRFYLLYSIDTPDEIAQLIQRLQET